MLAVGAALQWEVRPVLRALKQVRVVRRDEHRAWIGRWHDREVLVFRTGIGPDRAAAATESILGAHPVSMLLNTGCAGALDPALAIGDLVIASRILDSRRPSWEATPAAAWNERLRHAAVGASLPHRVAPSLTSPSVIADLAGKQDSYSTWQTAAVDMEAAALAFYAIQHSLPFANIRSVLDTAATPVPSLDDLTRPDGAVRPLKALQKISRNPAILFDFLSLAYSANLAENALGRLFRSLFSQVP